MTPTAATLVRVELVDRARFLVNLQGIREPPVALCARLED